MCGPLSHLVRVFTQRNSDIIAVSLIKVIFFLEFPAAENNKKKIELFVEYMQIK